MGNIVRAASRLLTLDRDLEVSGTGCTLLKNEAALICAHVQRLSKQLHRGSSTVAR